MVIVHYFTSYSL